MIKIVIPDCLMGIQIHLVVLSRVFVGLLVTGILIVILRRPFSIVGMGLIISTHAFIIKFYKPYAININNIYYIQIGRIGHFNNI